MQGPLPLWLTRSAGLARGLGKWQKVFSCWNFCEPPPARPSPSLSRGVQRLGGVRGSQPVLPPAPWPGPCELRRCHSPAPERGHSRGSGVALRGPRTAALSHPLLPHQSHELLLAPSTDPICGCFHNNLPALSGPFCCYTDAEIRCVRDALSWDTATGLSHPNPSWLPGVKGCAAGRPWHAGQVPHSGKRFSPP